MHSWNTHLSASLKSPFKKEGFSKRSRFNQEHLSSTPEGQNPKECNLLLVFFAVWHLPSLLLKPVSGDVKVRQNPFAMPRTYGRSFIRMEAGRFSCVSGWTWSQQSSYISWKRTSASKNHDPHKQRMWPWTLTRPKGPMKPQPHSLPWKIGLLHFFTSQSHFQWMPHFILALNPSLPIMFLYYLSRQETILRKISVHRFSESEYTLHLSFLLQY